MLKRTCIPIVLSLLHIAATIYLPISRILSEDWPIRDKRHMFFDSHIDKNGVTITYLDCTASEFDDKQMDCTLNIKYKDFQKDQVQSVGRSCFVIFSIQTHVVVQLDHKIAGIVHIVDPWMKDQPVKVNHLDGNTCFAKTLDTMIIPYGKLHQIFRQRDSLYFDVFAWNSTNGRLTWLVFNYRGNFQTKRSFSLHLTHPQIYSSSDQAYFVLDTHQESQSYLYSISDSCNIVTHTIEEKEGRSYVYVMESESQFLIFWEEKVVSMDSKETYGVTSYEVLSDRYREVILSRDIWPYQRYSLDFDRFSIALWQMTENNIMKIAYVTKNGRVQNLVEYRDSGLPDNVGTGSMRMKITSVEDGYFFSYCNVLNSETDTAGEAWLRCDVKRLDSAIFERLQ